jgi:hypothetical protein
MVAPPAPDPVSAAHPEPRVAWADGSLRALAYAWPDADTYRTTYLFQARHGQHWQTATGAEVARIALLLVALIDTQQQA